MKRETGFKPLLFDVNLYRYTLGQLSRVATINLDNTQVAAVPEEVLKGCGALVTLSLHGCPIRVDMLEATPGYAGFAQRVKGKHSKKIHGGAMVGLYTLNSVDP
jgi:hypothetical protein